MQIQSSSNLKRYNHLSGEIQACYHEASLKFGISDSVSIILYTICNAGEKHSLSAICKESGLTKQTVNSALRRLESDGIVYTEAVDGKSKNVCLTDRGKEYVKGNALKLINLENDIFSSWDEEDVQKYLGLTERFLVSLKERTSRL